MQLCVRLFVINCSQTEEGIEYLQNAKRLETTDIDRKSLKEKYGKEGTD